MSSNMNINVLVLGPVSAGKSTLTNLMFVEQFSDMKIKRTTAVPQIYRQSNNVNEKSDFKKILDNNRKINNDIMKKTEDPNYKLKLEDIKEIEYFVPKLFDFLNLRKDVVLSVYDTPGLNDSRTKDVYYEYIRNVFNKLNIVILVLDINSALNTSDENDILKMIIENILKNKNDYNVETKLVVLLNKCDDMSYDKDKQQYCLDEELQEMYNQAKNIIDTTAKELSCNFKYEILPISCEDSYVYRMYQRDPNATLDLKHLNKFGANEYGKSKWNVMSPNEKQARVSELFKDFNYEDRIAMTGFKRFKSVMQEILNDKYQYKFLLDHIKLDLQSIINNYNKIDITNELNLFEKYHSYLKNLIDKFEKSLFEFKFLYDAFDGFIMNYSRQFTEAFWTNLKSTKSIDTYILIHNMYMFFNKHFIKDRNYVFSVPQFNEIKGVINTIIEQIVISINTLWIEKMDNSSLSFDELLQYFDKLYENNYEILHELIVRKLSNVSFYKNIYNNHYYTDEIGNMLDNIEQRYKFPRGMITDLAITIASNTYSMLITKDFVPVMSLCSHWQNVLVLSSNKYYKKILCFKNTFKVDVLNMDAYLKADNIPCHYMSDYIIKRIKNEYPDEITTFDDIVLQSKTSMKKQELVKQDTVSKLDQVFIESKLVNNILECDSTYEFA